MPIQHINPKELFSIDQMSQIVVAPAAKLAFISGQTAANAHFEIVGGDDLYAQSVQALRHLKIAVEAAGGSLISATVYIKNLTPEAGENYIRALSMILESKLLPVHAFTMVGVQALGAPELLVEISGIAAIGQ